MRRRDLLGYTAGPYRGATAFDVERNIQQAEATAKALWDAGYTALCPHTNARPHLLGPTPESAFMEGDIVMLLRCDFVFLVPGWEKSQGTKAEIEVAKKHGIPVFTTLAEVEAWALCRVILRATKKIEEEQCSSSCL